MPTPVTAATATLLEPWTRWQGETIHGRFGLQRLLGRSDHSVSFLTRSPDGSDATIKMIPAGLAPGEVLLARWRTTAALSHPQLMRILDLGRDARNDQPFLFVVMEYAQETLAEVLPQRPLSADEVKGLLPPVLDALSYLHRNHLLHGQLKPANVLVVNDEVKLSSDSIRPVGDATAGVALPSPYDPPEFGQGRVTTAADIWALGITLVETLTQHAPVWDESHTKLTLPAGLPVELSDMIQRCLSAQPEHRPGASALKAFIQGEAALPVPAVAPIAPIAPATSVIKRAPAAAVARSLEPERPSRSGMPLVVIAVTAVIVAGWFMFRHSSMPVSPPAIPAATAPTSALPAPVPPTLPVATAPVADSTIVVHRVEPILSHSASESIRGHFPVVIRVQVDRAGNVVDSSFEEQGPSGYFARAANTAARGWKFSPGPSSDLRSWRLRFEFSRGDTTVQADPIP